MYSSDLNLHLSSLSSQYAVASAAAQFNTDDSGIGGGQSEPSNTVQHVLDEAGIQVQKMFYEFIVKYVPFCLYTQTNKTNTQTTMKNAEMLNSQMHRVMNVLQGITFYSNYVE